MSHYLDDPEMTAQTIVDGWLLTGDLGRFEATGHLAAFWAQEEHDRHRGREEYLSRGCRDRVRWASGEGILRVRGELYLAAKALGQEMLVLVLRLEQSQTFNDSLASEIVTRNRRLADYKRVGGYLVWEKDFPRTASLKIKRGELAEEIGKAGLRTGDRRDLGRRRLGATWTGPSA